MLTDESVINPDKYRLGKCGSGVVIYSKFLRTEPLILSNHISNYSSSYNSEISAITFFLKECLKISLSNVKTIHILSDCQSAILSSTNSKIAYEYKEEINEIHKTAKHFNEKRIKVSGHNGIEGNILAGHAAKNGAALTSTNNYFKITLQLPKKQY